MEDKRSATLDSGREWDSMKSPQQRLNKMVEKLREHEYRITPQRLALLKVLAMSQDHPSAEDIYARLRRNFPTTSLATIYKTVGLLKEMGEVWELGFGDGRNRYDGNKPYPHPHLVCIQCKRIIDSDVKGMSDISEDLSQKTGFQIVSYRLDFFGICPECQGRKEF